MLKQAGIETGEKKDKAPDAPQHPEEYGRRAWAQRRSRVSRGAKGRSSARVVKGGRSVSGWVERGKVYPQREPGVLVRIKGQAPLAATVYELEKLRCNLCGDVFTAAAPEGAGEKKYDETAASMIALLRYGSGVPVESAGRPGREPGHPAAGGDAVRDRSGNRGPAPARAGRTERQAAQGEVVHNDDTSMRVLSLDRDADISPDRTGVFTSGIVWTFQERRIALFFTGCKHAGENLAEVLKQRPADLPPPIQMCDALSRNVPKVVRDTGGQLFAHGRRNFVEVTSNFPEECRFVLETSGRSLRLRRAGAEAGHVSRAAPRTSTRSTAGR